MGPYWIVLGTVCAGLLVAVLGASARNQTGLTLIDSFAGRDTFDSYCAPCHGTTGTGNGPVAPGLRTRPADLTRLAQRAGGVFPRGRVETLIAGTGRAVQAHGSAGMPVWGPIFRAFESDARVQARIAGLVTYLESIQVPPKSGG